RLKVLEGKFRERAVPRGISPEAAADVWSNVVSFASYSFNKAHASSYAQLAYQSAYLKTHFPEEFAAAVLNNYGGMYPLRTVAAELARFGIRILRPCVNTSHLRSSVERDGAYGNKVV